MKNYLNYNFLAVLAHRGGSLESSENTFESFDYSISLGCKFIETDVQLSSDGIPYIFHDNNLKRQFGINKLFHSLTAEEIDKLRIDGLHEIPKLRDVLHKYRETYFQIDVKTDEVVIPALEVIYEMNANDRVCIASFSSKRLKLVREKYSNICISMGPVELIKLILKSFGFYKKAIPGDCIQVPIYRYGFKIVTKRFVKFVKKSKLKIMVWTINDQKTMKKLIAMNVDGIITDKPKKLFNILDNR